MPGRSDPNIYYSLCKHRPFLLRDCGVGERPGISRLVEKREDKRRRRRATRFSVERKGETASVEYRDKASVRDKGRRRKCKKWGDMANETE